MQHKMTRDIRCVQGLLTLNSTFTDTPEVPCQQCHAQVVKCQHFSIAWSAHVLACRGMQPHAGFSLDRTKWNVLDTFHLHGEDAASLNQASPLNLTLFDWVCTHPRMLNIFPAHNKVALCNQLHNSAYIATCYWLFNITFCSRGCKQLPSPPRENIKDKPEVLACAVQFTLWKAVESRLLTPEGSST